MNKNTILQGVQKGRPLTFGIPFSQEQIDKTKYGRRQFALLEEESLQLLKSRQRPLSYQQFRLFWETGDRQEYQNVYFEKRRRLLVHALLTWQQPENKIQLHALEDILWEICGEPMWSLPAHFLSREEEDLAMEKYSANLDLFACETGFAIAETLRICGKYLDERCRKFAEITISERILEPFSDNRNFYRFEVMANNWASVCAGAIGCVGILYLKDEEVLTNFLHRVISGIEVYLDSFGEDGVCVEGVDYFSYGFGFFVCFADYLRERTGGAIDYFKLKKVKQIALSQQVFYLEEPFTLSFADGNQRGRFRLGLTSYLKRQYHTLKIPAMQSAQDIVEDSCSRFCLALRDILWYQKEENEQMVKESQWLPDAQWFISYGRIFTLAAKGGNNAESHNHNDCGSFVLYKQGKEMLVDLGAGLYDKDYFSEKRYTYFVPSSRSHCVPMIDGKEQKAGKTFAAKRVKAELEIKNNKVIDSFEAGLEECYDHIGLIEFTRSMEHEKESGKMILCDSFTMKAPLSIQERFISHKPFQILEQSAVLDNEGVSLTMTFESNISLSTAEELYYDHEGEEKTAYLLLAEVEKTAGATSIYVLME